VGQAATNWPPCPNHLDSHPLAVLTQRCLPAGRMRCGRLAGALRGLRRRPTRALQRQPGVGRSRCREEFTALGSWTRSCRQQNRWPMGNHRATRMSRSRRHRGPMASDASSVIATGMRSGVTAGDSGGRHRADATGASMRWSSTRDRALRSDTQLPAVTNAVCPDEIPQLIAMYTGGRRAEQQPGHESR